MKRRDFIATVVAAAVAPASVAASPGTPIRVVSEATLDSSDHGDICSFPRTKFFHDLDISSSYYNNFSIKRLNLEGLGYV